MGLATPGEEHTGRERGRFGFRRAKRVGQLAGSRPPLPRTGGLASAGPLFSSGENTRAA